MFGKNKEAMGLGPIDSTSPLKKESLTTPSLNTAPKSFSAATRKVTAPAIAQPERDPAVPQPGRDTIIARGVPAGLPMDRGRAALSNPASALAMPNSRTEPDESPGARQMTVGRQIAISGEITHCGTLTVDGCVDAKLTDSDALHISESGLFRGHARIRQAEIAGRFEGDLTVTELLIVRSTGRIVGEIRYGELEIDRGGKLFGLIETVEPLPGMAPLELASENKFDDEGEDDGQASEPESKLEAETELETETEFEPEEELPLKVAQGG